MSAASDIVLVTINAKWIHPSLALRLLKANLGSLQDRCQILEFALRQPLNEKVDPILAARPRLLGFSVSIWNHLATLELLKALCELWPQVSDTGWQKPIVVLGGPEVSWLPEGSEIFGYADYVIRGEGEESFRLLCEEIFCGKGGAAPGGLGGAVLRDQGYTCADLDKIATAYQLYTDEDLTRKLVYVEASRGCPYGCEFCQAARTQPVREFPLEPFLAEMETLISRGAKTFKFLDRTFNLNMERVKRILEFFLERFSESYNGLTKPQRQVHFEMVPSRFPPELKELLKRFPPGTLRLEIGIQTFNRETSELIHRSGVPEEELEILEFLRKETNAILHVDLIAGLPGEGYDSFGAGFDKLWRALSAKPAEMAGGSGAAGAAGAACAAFEIQLGILKCLPGTPIARHNQVHKMRYSPEPPYEVVETGALSQAELGRIKNYARFWELIVNRNSYPEQIARLLPPGEPVFERFMALSDKLLEHFGKNWGIDRRELGSFLDSVG